MSLRSIQLWSLPPLACHPVAVFCEDIFDNILGSRLLRGKEEIVNNCPSRVAHGKWLGNVFESRYFPKPQPKTLGYYPVLFFFWFTEEVPCRCISNSPPGIIAPKTVHPIDIRRIHTLRISPKDIAIHISNRKVQKQINTT